MRGVIIKKVILFGAGQIGTIISRLLGAEYTTMGFIDNYSPKWGTVQAGIPVMSPAEGLELKPDAIVICVLDKERSAEMSEVLNSLGFEGETIYPGALKVFDSRYAVMRLLCNQLISLGIEGDAAELGVYKGDFAAGINAALSDRRIHLFDTFEGFDERDVAVEKFEGLSGAKTGDFSDTSCEAVKQRLPYPDKAIFYKGYFPYTFEECAAECFSFVSIDADLYTPTAAALPIFWDRLSKGGVIMVHDVISTQFTGAKKAVDEFCKDRGIIPTPVADLHGSVILRKV